MEECSDVHCHACDECIQPKYDERITTSEFYRDHLENNDFCEECFEILLQAQDRCHLGLIIFDPDVLS